MQTIVSRVRTRGFCMIMTDQRSGVRKLEVPVNGASMQLSVEPRHHLRDWDQAVREESLVPS